MSWSVGEKLVDRWGSTKRRLWSLPGPRDLRTRRRTAAGLRVQPAHLLLDRDGADIVAALKTDGIWVGALDSALASKIVPGIQVEGAVHALASLRGRGRASTVHLPRWHTWSQAAYLAGLRSHLNLIFEGYTQLPALFLGADLKREIADKRTLGVRQWHRDVEDDAVLKAIIYLDEVDESAGPFEYVEEAASAILANAIRYGSGFVPDMVVQQHIDTRARRTCPGGAGTLIIFDGARLFHRAQPPSRQDRLSLTFTYASTLPRQIFVHQRPSRRLLRLLDTKDRSLLGQIPSRFWL